MRNLWQKIVGFMEADGQAALITLAQVDGSSPREAGTYMAMRKDGRFTGTIGGGALEWQALAEAQKLLHIEGGRGILLPLALGPSLGQCCGGRVLLRIEAFSSEDRGWITALARAEEAASSCHTPLETHGIADARGVYVRHPVSSSENLDRRGHSGAKPLHESFGEVFTPLLLFGAGHVGRALVLALAPLPFHIRWIDPRAGEFPAASPANARLIASDNPEAELLSAKAGSFILIMTHSHALDLALCAAALRRADLPFIGMIGSQTKRARFLGQLAATGLGEAARTRLICPIGVTGLTGKHPAMIAASVAVQLLQAREKVLQRQESNQQGSFHAQG